MDMNTKGNSIEIDVIKELNGKSGLEYERYRGTKLVQKVKIKRFIINHEINESLSPMTYFLLINSCGKLISNAFYYLNHKLKDCTYKERESSLTALKHLYTFLELFYYREESDINKETFSKFITFLKGGRIESYECIFAGNYIRTNKTLNDYMSVYRKYYKYLNIKNSFFEEAKDVTFYSENFDTGHREIEKVEKFDSSSPIVKKNKVPKYLSYYQYVQCIKYLSQRKKNYVITLRDIVIIHLMYEYGLRIGEVLGLTVEDFFNLKETKSEQGCLIIRNRFTDKPWQFAKGCMKINSREKYKDSDYDEEGIGLGYQRINIENATVTLIEDYMKETVLSSTLSKKLADNLKHKNNADVVAGREEVIKENKYLIVSKNLTPITSTSWNRNMKEIFKALNIKIDKDRKKENLNHRMRHGFAMYKVMIEGYDILRLKYAMRHKKTKTCEIYFNPTDEDMAEMGYKAKDLLKNGGISID